ncbi:unnamed protein product [Tilletia controversa]|nr:unnamed protein product [Tilletia controversa]CAD6949825.1 unnamed protein product [Tilletia controversa]CAD6972617.1 unnamed protein product [Tilletia controversa]CAD6983961.1 unnamed protein product [Tilletia controversa]CAD7066641.1 unnamed protein product [Tilletia caries]
MDLTEGRAGESAGPGPGPGPGTTASRAARKRAAEADDAEASLRKRMAGPSSGKAGLSADQEEINRKIYEASRGSKFFQNERIKDAETTQRIAVLLAKRDDALSRISLDSPEWRAIEKKIDLRRAELEATRDLSRQICHVDADQFYAAVELKRDPTLKGKAFGVGSGVLTTASYEARQKGCRSGQAVFVAKALCPELIVVRNDFKAYVQASSDIMEILGSYDENLQPASLDEAYLDITDYCTQHQMTAEQVLRKEVEEETGLTVSVGIAANKTLAKICSDKNKPNGQYDLPHDRDGIMQFTETLKVRKIPGIGRVTERILQAVNVETCGDIWKQRHELFLTFGSSIDQLLSAYLGLGSTHVRPNDRRERKSVGRETTFRPTNDLEQMKAELRSCADQVEKDLERTHFKGRTVTLVAKKDTYQRFTRAKSGNTYLHKADDLYQITLSLLLAEIAELARSDPAAKLTLRLIGVRMTHLKDLQPPDNQIKKLFEAAGSKAPDPDQGGRPTYDREQDDLEEALRLSLLENSPTRGIDLAHEFMAAGTASDRHTPVLEHDPQHGGESIAIPSASSTHKKIGGDSSALSTGDDAVRSPQKRSNADRSGPQATSSSISPPRPKVAEKQQGLQFQHAPAPAQSVASRPIPAPEESSSNGSAIPHSTACPICQASLSFWSNAELNAQIDACLEGRGHQSFDAKDSKVGRPEQDSALQRPAVNPSPAARPRKSQTVDEQVDDGKHASRAPQRRKSGKEGTREKQQGGAGTLDLWLQSRKRTDS